MVLAAKIVRFYEKAIAVMLEIVIFAKSNLVFGIAMSNEPKDNDVKGYFAASILLSEVQWGTRISF